MTLNDTARGQLENLTRKTTLDELVERYHWSRMPRICLGRRARLFLRRSHWAATVRGGSAIKRMMDVAGAAVLMLLSSPVFVLVALAIKFSDGGKVLFW